MVREGGVKRSIAFEGLGSIGRAVLDQAGHDKLYPLWEGLRLDPVLGKVRDGMIVVLGVRALVNVFYSRILGVQFMISWTCNDCMSKACV